MHMDLRRKSDGYVYIQHLLDGIADGSFNFLNPNANSQATMDYLMPTAIANSTSDMVQVQANASGDLLDLPGGPLQLGVGVSFRYEAIDSPSINRSEEHTSELQSLMRISYAVFCLKKKQN